LHVLSQSVVSRGGQRTQKKIYDVLVRTGTQLKPKDWEVSLYPGSKYFNYLSLNPRLSAMERNRVEKG
jgi:hypothetical protein